ncbi:hypothetical protein PCANC_04487 [Puccinia coronata f. sp. avenae]|uniref:Uncharacterized protein n=1 Tax=Puccinia coronata f. sp. avenae TaxID=200324 RepID=A0A2N5T1Y3_9BASI|nr:hypothetical protein PCANC_08767 [Puccinia coronata f. sp. avenae]PLW39552.1 hypothetical protein PCASD_07686 [Puccinia coronata f. sp. avenae]PLW53710.1 hypothetical protein PCANC_04487 [Puccinia coronata f. sp. avenae]
MQAPLRALPEEEPAGVKAKWVTAKNDGPHNPDLGAPGPEKQLRPKDSQAAVGEVLGT